MKALFLIVIIATGSIFLWFLNGTAAINSKDTSQKTFVIDNGESARQIGSSLAQAGLIKNAWLFFLSVKFSGSDKSIQSGTFRLSSSQSLQSIIASLVKGPLDVWITIPEGKRATEIAESLSAKIPAYDLSWRNQLIANEGYLFPDTYLFPKDTTIDFVIKTMRGNFDKKYQLALIGQTVSFPQNQAVILASIVQREGKSNADMKSIAAVLENRLSIGMALQADATMQYVVGNSINWWPQIGASTLRIDSPYNTYRNTGLPPSPIANPGLVALQAVFQPSKSNYLYYFTDRKGQTHFAQTLDEQNANIAKFGL